MSLIKKIEKTPFYSKKIGKLPKGCRMCVKGEKLVLYITGICPRKCWYCPLSEKRKDKDVIYANEWKVNSIDEVIKEAKISSSKGAGITGGDPLAKIDRTCEYIIALKKEFGKKFHVHLYTTFFLCTKENMKKLYEAGLDEIRFHPDFSKKEQWNRIEYALNYPWEVGLEIPSLKEEEKGIYDMIDYFEGKVKFLNINELEVSERNLEEMQNRNLETKSDISHGIKGSEKFAKELLKYCLNKKINVHYCTSKLKDKVQMQNRFKLRAKKVKTKYDIITDEGLLIRGIIYLKDLHPTIKDFKKIFENLNKKEIILKLELLKKDFKKEVLEVLVDEKKLRLITYPEHVEQFADILKKEGFTPAIIEEDPTVESYEVNIDYL